MPSAARLTDTCTGHGGFPSRAATSASTNVSINGLGAHRVSDAWETHSDGNSSHGSVLATGSSTVFANGMSLGRIGDTIQCGSTVVTGSQDVFAG